MGGQGLGSPETMTTQISSRSIVRITLVLLLCATPLTAFAQTTTTTSAAGSAPVPTLAENLSVTPKFGQTQEQLAADRAECQLWAKGQTGFDPTQYGGGVGSSDYNVRRQQYGRALAACLEGHGYSVRFAALVVSPSTNNPPPSPPPVAPAPVVAAGVHSSRRQLQLVSSQGSSAQYRKLHLRPPRLLWRRRGPAVKPRASLIRGTSLSVWRRRPVSRANRAAAGNLRQRHRLRLLLLRAGLFSRHNSRATHDQRLAQCLERRNWDGDR